MRLGLGLLVALLLLAPAPAGAAVSRKKAIWGPVTEFATYADLGAGIYQSPLNWSTVAVSRPAAATDPADPAYRWPADIDTALAEGARYGIAVSLMVTGTPRWANGGRAPRFAPRDPRDYADFAAAAARRYPGVKLWMIWGEPTKASNFQPASAARYARLLDAAYGALKRIDRRNLVIGGNTYTVGTVTPQRWIRGLRLPNGKPPRMDLFGHNPFSARRP